MTLSARNISHSYGGAPVLYGVDLTLKSGRVHALIGPNGSGKSTLIKILTGVERPVTGALLLDGAEQSFASPAYAAAAGVGVVHQHYHLFGDLTVADNVRGVVGGVPRRRSGLLDHRRAAREVGESLHRLGIDVDPRALVRTLDAAERKMVEIARALVDEPRFLILDEPTASLESGSAKSVLDLIGRLRTRDIGVCFVSHRLDEVVEAADEITVLRDGRRLAHLDRRAENERELIDFIAGGEPPPAQDRRRIDDGRLVVSVRDVRLGRTAGPVRLDVRAGEVIALHGLIGSGASRLVRMVGGAERLTGQAVVDGREVTLDSPRRAQAAGIGFLPEDRKAGATFAALSLSDNIVLPSIRRYGRFGVLDRGRMRADSERYRSELAIVSPSARAPLGALSGGNQQKALIARWLCSDVAVLAIEEPTNGVDVRGRMQIHGLLRQFARTRGAVLVACSEPEEAIALADRIAVLRHGEIVAVLDASSTTEQRLAELSATDAPAARGKAE